MSTRSISRTLILVFSIALMFVVGSFAGSAATPLPQPNPQKADCSGTSDADIAKAVVENIKKKFTPEQMKAQVHVEHHQQKWNRRDRRRCSWHQSQEPQRGPNQDNNDCRENRLRQKSCYKAFHARSSNQVYRRPKNSATAVASTKTRSAIHSK